MTGIKYDIIIIGAGPSGLTAGLYASRSRMKTLLLEKMGCGGQAAITDMIENYPGFPEGIAGYELAVKMEEQAKKFGLEVKYEQVKDIDISSNDKKVITDTSSYTAKAIILSSGAEFKKLNVPGELEFIGKGVSYCATCDGPFFKDKEVAVIGGGDSAVGEAVYLTKFAKKVYLIHRRSRLRATKVVQEKAFSNPKIEMVLESTVSSVNGTEKVDSVTVKNVKTNESRSISLNGVFVFIGWTPNNEFIKDKIKLDKSGYVVTDDNMKTSTDGVYASGDLRSKTLRQVVTAAGEGATAAFCASQYIEEIEGTLYK